MNQNATMATGWMLHPTGVQSCLLFLKWTLKHDRWKHPIFSKVVESILSEKFVIYEITRYNLVATQTLTRNGLYYDGAVVFISLLRVLAIQVVGSCIRLIGPVLFASVINKRSWKAGLWHTFPGEGDGCCAQRGLWWEFLVMRLVDVCRSPDYM